MAFSYVKGANIVEIGSLATATVGESKTLY